MNIPFESKLESIVDIKERNVVFHNLDDSDKRREIAYDLFKLILNSHIDANACGYWDGEYLDNWGDNSTPSELHTYLNELEIYGDTCEVCARGGMMLSQIRLGNTISPDNQNIFCGDPYILEGFTMAEMYDMEILYEGFTIRSSGYQADIPQTWINSHPYDTCSRERLVNICLSVITNGAFLRIDTTDYLKKYSVKLPAVDGYDIFD